jgi:hypothetical protein
VRSVSSGGARNIAGPPSRGLTVPSNNTLYQCALAVSPPCEVTSTTVPGFFVL